MNSSIVSEVIEEYKLELISESSIANSFKKWISKVILWFKKLWYKIKSFFTGKKNKDNENLLDLLQKSSKSDSKQINYFLVKGVENIEKINNILEDKIFAFEEIISKIKNDEVVDINENELKIDTSEIQNYFKKLILKKSDLSRYDIECLPYTDNEAISDIVLKLNNNIDKLFKTIIDEMNNLLNKTNVDTEKIKRVILNLQKSIQPIVSIHKNLCNLKARLFDKSKRSLESTIKPVPAKRPYFTRLFYPEKEGEYDLIAIRSILIDTLNVFKIKEYIYYFKDYAESKLGNNVLYIQDCEKNIPYIENIDRDTFNKLTVNLLLNFNEENFNNMIENTEDFYVKNWYKNNI